RTHLECTDAELAERRTPRVDIVAERVTGTDEWGLDEGPFLVAGTMLGLILGAVIVDGYLGTVLTQTLSFAIDEFGRGNTAQGVVFGIVRFGVLVTLIMSVLADRRGRRPLLLFTGVSSCALTFLGGLSPNLAVLGGTQLFARGLSTALGILVAIMAVWVLPLADLSVRGWRAIYLLGSLGILVIVWAWRRLPETRRFAKHFAAPASGFHNEFLREERGFSGSAITIFTLVTATPIGLGVLVGGRLSETWGRRKTAALGIVAGVVGTTLSFVFSGPAMWAAKLGGNVIGAVGVPAMAVYGPELFGTHDRGRANALIVTAGVVGSAIGLVSVGWLSDRWDAIAPAIALLGVGPLLVALLVLTRFPETGQASSGFSSSSSAPAVSGNLVSTSSATRSGPTPSSAMAGAIAS
ncbi:MAG: MFS transporter, partial [Actinobacteria bacterium]|nr:MFS transporter [Actinomycetota bacterium]